MFYFIFLQWEESGDVLSIFIHFNESTHISKNWNSTIFFKKVNFQSIHSLHFTLI